MDRKHHRRPALLPALLLLLLSATHVLAKPITTTWTETETNTYTSTITPKGGGGGGGGAEPTPPVDKSKPCVPQEEGWTACGWVCCDYYQECVEDGQCRIRDGFEEPPGDPIVITTDGVVTTLFSAPFRVTSDGAESTGGAGSGGSNEEDDGSGLSGGAIAGIVVGTLAGVALLGMICFCCIARGIFGAIFGGKKKKRRDREEVIEDRYTRRHSRPPGSSGYHTKRGSHSSWYGSGSSRDGEKKKSGGAKWLGIGAMAATLLALLNIKKDKKPARRTPTMYSDSYMYTDSTLPSMFRFPPLFQLSLCRWKQRLTLWKTGSSSSGGGSKRPSRYSRHSGARSHRPRSYYTEGTRRSGPRGSRGGSH